MQNNIIIVAGGSGKRFGSEIPKQFLEISGLPLLMHTIKRFYEYDQGANIVLVLPENQFGLWRNLCKEHCFDFPVQLISGGSERFYSVKNGLDAMPACDYVAVHDGVRPCITVGFVDSCFAQAKKYGAVIPVIPVTDSLRKGHYSNSVHFDRRNLWRVQTPQVFRSDWLLSSYDVDYSADFTDDASVVETSGFKIQLIDGLPQNIKVTQKEDLELAGFYLRGIDTN